MFLLLKEGDLVKRVFCHPEGLEKDENENPCTKWVAEVVKIGERTLSVEFTKDGQLAVETFVRKTGINVYGDKNYHLERMPVDLKILTKDCKEEKESCRSDMRYCIYNYHSRLQEERVTQI